MYSFGHVHHNLTNSNEIRSGLGVLVNVMEWKGVVRGEEARFHSQTNMQSSLGWIEKRKNKEMEKKK